VGDIMVDLIANAVRECRAGHNSRVGHYMCQIRIDRSTQRMRRLEAGAWVGTEHPK
jgi:hypothetical protein